MVLQATTKINRVTGSRHTIYLKTDLVNDSKFPFKVGQPLLVRIDGSHLIIEDDRSREQYSQKERDKIQKNNKNEVGDN
jgi:hypothetical protein